MKFVQVNKAQGLELGKNVFTVNDAGEFGFGKLIERTEDLKDGKMHKFRMASFEDMSGILFEALTDVLKVVPSPTPNTRDAIENAQKVVDAYRESKTYAEPIVANVVQVAIPSKVVKTND